MKLSEIMDNGCVAVRCALPDKAAVLREIVRLAGSSPALKPAGAETILSALQHRESLGSTGFGKGVAIPHCRLKDLDRFVLGLLTIPDGADFDSVDGKKVHVVVFVIGPEAPSSAHIRLLSRISQVTTTHGILEELLAAATPEAAWRTFVQHAECEMDAGGSAGRCLFQVIVQNERLFHDILQVFSAMDAASEVVLEARQSSEYLTRVPLFAGLVSDGYPRFCRVICAIVDASMRNEAIRRIEAVAGDLDKTSDLLLIVQDVAYAAGAIAI